MKRDSIANTFIVALSLCLVCSFLVALAAVGLKPFQDRNVLLDKKKNILSAAGLLKDFTGSVSQLYDQRVIDRIVDLQSGEDVTERLVAEHHWSGAIEFNQADAAKNDKVAKALPSDQDIANIKRREPYSHVYIVKKSQDDPSRQCTCFPFAVTACGRCSRALSRSMRT